LSSKTLASKYIASADRVFERIHVSEVCLNVDVDLIKEVLESAKAYLEDAKYYREKQKFEVCLTSVAYCEGLLDALRLLGAVEFRWPDKQGKRNEI
jgi:FAD synthetase